MLSSPLFSQGIDSNPSHPYYSTSTPPLHQPMRGHYSNPGSVPGSQPFTPNMSEPPSGLMTPHSEFELPLDFDEYAHGAGSYHHSGVQTPGSHPHSGHHTPSHPHHSGIHTPSSHPHSAHHSGIHTPAGGHSGVHTPNHYQQMTSSYPPNHTPPIPHHPVLPPSSQLPTHSYPQPLPPSQQPMGPGYYRVQQQSSNYNPPSPALMDTANTGWIDTDL